MNGPVELARHIYRSFRVASKQKWGQELDRLLSRQPTPEAQYMDWQQERWFTSLGEYVSSVKAHDESSRAPLIRYDGKPMGRLTPTISIRKDDGSRQLCFWLQVSPAEWIAAVTREVKVAEGRATMAAKRSLMAERIQKDPALLQLKDMQAVATQLGWTETEIDLDVIV